MSPTQVVSTSSRKPYGMQNGMGVDEILETFSLKLEEIKMKVGPTHPSLLN